ncbi:anti-sigma factor antagonist [Leptospira montravelensis]|uniref:Anti-sigma factor antagonist n=1 Tax=Leptospira montravelensis TaxID=2484961 RepID=A0ABY2LS93_9LEPT|nr:STAS domain-containing protein [Leptospira montravelensis]TGK78709.1 anti-sigma factor antagonist [Leptospira montravelensis]TGL02412.1 anti-sigma factor antagonist [Leptospira montravelensis]
MEAKDKVFSIQLKGGLDGTSAEDFYRYFESQVGKGYRKFLFQFGALDFITSNGISVIVKIHKQITKIGAVYAIYGVKQEVEDVLTLVGLFDKLPIFRDHNQAESFLLKIEPKLPNPPETNSSKESVSQAQVGRENRIRFYFTGKSKDRDSTNQEKEPVSQLESMPEQEMQEPVTQVKPSPSSPMELVLEEKLNSLRLEIKDTLNHELERRFAVYKSSPGSEEKRITIPSYIQSKTKQLETIERIIQCEVCGTRLRLHKFGKHECPGCSTQFEVSTNGSVRFLEKLNPL